MFFFNSVRCLRRHLSYVHCPMSICRLREAHIFIWCTKLGWRIPVNSIDAPQFAPLLLTELDSGHATISEHVVAADERVSPALTAQRKILPKIRFYFAPHIMCQNSLRKKKICIFFKVCQRHCFHN